MFTNITDNNYYYRVATELLYDIVVITCSRLLHCNSPPGSEATRADLVSVFMCVWGGGGGGVVEEVMAV